MSEFYYFSLSEIYLQFGKFEDCLALTREALDLEPDTPRGLQLSGTALVLQACISKDFQHLSLAREQIVRGLKQDRNLIGDVAAIAEQLINPEGEGMDSEALSDPYQTAGILLDTVTEADPTDISSWNRAAECHMDGDHLEQALNCSNQATRGFDAPEHMWETRGKILTQMGQSPLFRYIYIFPSSRDDCIDCVYSQSRSLDSFYPLQALSRIGLWPWSAARMSSSATATSTAARCSRLGCTTSALRSRTW